MAHRYEMDHEPEDAIAILKNDHRRIIQLFARYDASHEPWERQQIATVVFIALEVHEFLEETLFYPAYAQERGVEAMEWVQGAVHDHQQIQALITALRDCSAEEVAFDAWFHELMDVVHAHIREEEAELFPTATQYLAETMETLTEEMHEIRYTMTGA